MPIQRRAISLGVASFIVIALILIVGFGVLLASEFNSNAPKATINNSLCRGSPCSTSEERSSVSTTTTSKISATNESIGSPDGLRLDLSVTPSPNGSVGTWVISADEFNTLGIRNNVSLADNWLYSPYLLNPFNNCGSPAPVGFGVFQGYYDENNFTSGKALALFNTTFAITCSTTLQGNYHYLFAPQSSSTQLFDPTGGLAYNQGVSVSVSTDGFWTGGIALGSTLSAEFHTFSPGIYTVLGADEWGKVVLVHIDVASNGSIIGTSTSATLPPLQSSTDLVCVTTNYQVLGIESMTVQNGTTVYLPVSTTTRTAVETTVTTTTNVTETVNYVTATTSYSPPSSWTVIECSYVE